MHTCNGEWCVIRSISWNMASISRGLSSWTLKGRRHSKRQLGCYCRIKDKWKELMQLHFRQRIWSTMNRIYMEFVVLHTSHKFPSPSTFLVHFLSSFDHSPLLVTCSLTPPPMLSYIFTSQTFPYFIFLGFWFLTYYSISLSVSVSFFLFCFGKTVWY